MNIGIDKIGFSMPDYYLNIEDLARKRSRARKIHKKGLMQPRK